jgi:hypothetical protein
MVRYGIMLYKCRYRNCGTVGVCLWMGHICGYGWGTNFAQIRSRVGWSQIGMYGSI